MYAVDSDEEADQLWQNSSCFMGQAWFEPFGFRRGMIDPDTGEYPSPECVMISHTENSVPIGIREHSVQLIPGIAMSAPPILPKSEALRRAVAWLAHQGPWTPELIEQASQRFDLSPTEEQFLLEQARRPAE